MRSPWLRPQSPPNGEQLDRDEAYLLGLPERFRDEIERKVDGIVRRLGVPATAEALEELAATAAEEGDKAARRKDRQGSANGRTIAACLRFRAQRMRTKT